MKKLVLAIVLLLTCMFVYTENSANASIYTVPESDSPEMARLYQFYSRLRVCKRTNFITPYGDMVIRKNNDGTCFYATTFQGNTFECNFPNDAANKYSLYKRASRLSNQHYEEMRNIERRYCKNR